MAASMELDGAAMGRPRCLPSPPDLKRWSPLTRSTPYDSARIGTLQFTPRVSPHGAPLPSPPHRIPALSPPTGDLNHL
jgi:hypothetical protein